MNSFGSGDSSEALDTTSAQNDDTIQSSAPEDKSDESHDALKASADEEYPMPGLLLSIREEHGATPIAEYEVLTDVDGKLSAAIEVASDSDIVVQSKQNWIAKLAISGAAADFARERKLTLQAEAMIDIIGACRDHGDHGYMVRFNYRNKNQPDIDTVVPLTALDPRLYRNTEITEDDLALNSIIYENGEPTLPHSTYVANGLGQKFNLGESSFTVPYDRSLGTLTWSFIGQSLKVDASAPICSEERRLTCTKLSEHAKKSVFKALRLSASVTLKLAARFWRKGKSPYLKSIASAVRSTRAALAALKGMYTCPAGASIKTVCAQKRFPYEKFEQLHARIFKVESSVKAALFRKLNRVRTKKFSSILRSVMPDRIISCPASVSLLGGHGATSTPGTSPISARPAKQLPSERD